MSTQNPTHKAVQEYYGNVAREAVNCCTPSASSEAATCCGTPSDTKKIQNDLYPLEMLDELPADIANFTAGSGDPISLAKLQPGESVLDLGSGAGLDCFLAARRVGQSGHVIGVDMTPEMLDRARSNAARVNLQNVEFREGFLEALPVDDYSTDVIISNCVVNLSPDKPQVFREMHRTLKPGGRIALSDMVANHPLPEDAGKGEGWCNCTAGALTGRAYQEELSKAGFVDIQLEPNVELVISAIESGRIQSQKGRSKEQLLEDLRNWEKFEGTMVVPHKITARKPA